MTSSVIFTLTFIYHIGKSRKHRCRWNLRVLEKMASSGDSAKGVKPHQWFWIFILNQQNPMCRQNLTWKLVLKVLVALAGNHLSRRELRPFWLWYSLRWGKLGCVFSCSPCTHCSVRALVSGTMDLAFPTPACPGQAIGSLGTSAPRRYRLGFIFL